MERKSKIFGTDGMRGIANAHPMTAEMALATGRGVAAVFRRGKGKHKIIIGKDTRLSGYMFENALVAGICSMGGDALLVGPMPTPAIAFLTRSMRADAGIVISASHNPYQDNGIKIFARDGYKLPDEMEDQIEAYVEAAASGLQPEPAPQPGIVGRARRIDDAPGRYIVFAKHSFPDDLVLDGLKIALDCAHGATYKVAPAVFKELGAEVVLCGDQPDGCNINDGVGALHPETVAAAVTANGCDLGLAFDGDGDRLIMVDENGQVVDGDQIMGICADDMMTRGTLSQATLVATVMSNLGLELAMRERGIRMLRTKVGDRYVVEAMRRGGFNLGGEQSGHILFLDHNTTGDGIVSGLQVLGIMVRTGRRLSELAQVMTRLPQVLINVMVSRKPPISERPKLLKAIAVQEERLGQEGRLLVRYSGTEPKLRIMVEAADEKLMNDVAEQLRQVVVADLCD